MGAICEVLAGSELACLLAEQKRRLVLATRNGGRNELLTDGPCVTWFTYT